MARVGRDPRIQHVVIFFRTFQDTLGRNFGTFIMLRKPPDCTLSILTGSCEQPIDNNMHNHSMHNPTDVGHEQPAISII